MTATIERLHLRTIQQLCRELGLDLVAEAASGRNTTDQTVTVDIPTVRAWARGKLDPDRAQLERLTELDYLFSREDCDSPKGFVGWLRGYKEDQYHLKVTRLNLLQQTRYEELEKELEEHLKDCLS